MEDTATLWFVQLDDFHLRRTEGASENELWLWRARARQADRKMTLPELAAFALLFQAYGGGDLKRFLLLARPRLRALFPGLLGYQRLSHWLGRLEPFLLDFLASRIPGPSGSRETILLDSTKIDSHLLKNRPKSLSRLARVGHSHEGAWIGLKLHLAVARDGSLRAWDLTPGNAHDLAPVKGGLLAGLRGLCFADSGYVSAQVRQDLKPQDLLLAAKPTQAMELERWEFEREWAKAYRQRQIVEGVFKVLKGSCGLLCRGVRAAAQLKARVWASLAAYCLRKSQAS